jgi:hypothetical protein
MQSTLWTSVSSVVRRKAVGELTERQRWASARKMIAAIVLGLLLASFAFAQFEKRRRADKGPRAVGLLQLAQNGKAHLVPIAIMIDGRFYDAGAYKADPVPLALQSDVVYEAEQTGVPQGLFTVAGAFHNNKNGWAADGAWKTEAQIEADKAKARTDAAKRNQKAPVDQDIGGPPKLKRPTDSAQSNPPAQTKNPPAPTSGSGSSSAPAGSQTSAPPSKSSDANRSQTASTSSGAIEDPNRPTLRHQAASDTTHEQTKAGGESEPLQGPLQFVPAISDAGGPDPRPYAYQMKPDEEQSLMQKMQAIAANEVRARAAHLGQENIDTKTPATKPATTKPGTRKSAAQNANKQPAPEFHDAQLRVFDLSSSNEPVLVFTGQAKLLGSDLDYMVALVARQDIYADVHKVFAQTTDDKHLDVVPRYELVDAVDANGDGVGELLFREVWDFGAAYSIYSVIGDQLWPLFEGKPGT